MYAAKKLNFDNIKRIVVKTGSGVLTKNSGLNYEAVESISMQICHLIENNLEVIFVSSGAMALGIKKIGLKTRPIDIPGRQAVAAVGQAGLMMEYEKSFSRFDKKVAQILLTSEDLNNRKRYLNARNTLNTLLEWHVVPIINENDTVAVKEIAFGDNDNLAAMITILMDADILINLTNIDGLFNKDPRENKDAEQIFVISEINNKVKQCASHIPGALGTGGMLSKIKAAQKVTGAGIPMVIANGEKPDILFSIFSGEKTGTYFMPKKEKLAKRKCWIAFSSKPKGLIKIDNGAKTAILQKGKSLLPIGIIKIEGSFSVGEPVQFQSANNKLLGTGLVNYSSSDVKKIIGLRTDQIEKRLGYKHYDEVIHRNNLAITC